VGDEGGDRHFRCGERLAGHGRFFSLRLSARSRLRGCTSRPKRA
jgi:hypothetical protein